MIRTSIGEYIDPEEPSGKWDVGGLLQWAQRMFKVALTQNQMRKMSPEEIEGAMLDAATEHYSAVDLSPIAVYLDPQYAYSALAEWARTKFGVAVEVGELDDEPKRELAALLRSRVRASYTERELAYPVEWCIERAFGQENVDRAAAAESVAQWVNEKYNADWTPERVAGHSTTALRDELVEAARSYRDGGLEREVDANLNRADGEHAAAWGAKRFGRAWNQKRFDAFEGDLREALIDQGRALIRWELTRLEHFVLLRIYDQAWKDHLLEMDHLKDAIAQRPLGGDQTHPQSQFAIEGRDLFTQMWARIAERVTEVIFKVRATAGDGRGGQAAPGGAAAMSFQHSDATGAGFASADQAAAMRAQNVDAKVETIRREQPRVGRNDPCPCGSGKKFKQCHGRT